MSRHAAQAVFVVVVMTAFGLRLFNLTAQPLRGDEAFTIQNWAQKPLSESLAAIATIEPHPVFTYVLFRGWGLLAGTSEFAMRFLPALINVLGVAALYALALRLAGRREAILAALLWAFHPFQIWHSQDARNYAIWAALSVVALWLGLRALRQSRTLDWLLYAAAAFTAANVFYFEWFSLTALAAYALLVCWRSWQQLRSVLIVQAIILLSSLLSFGWLQRNLIGSGGYGGTTGGGLDLPQLVTLFLPTLMFGSTLPSDVAAVVGIGVLLIVTSVLLWLFRVNRRSALLLALVGFLPILLLSLLSLRFDIFAPRYVLSAVPALLLIVTLLASGLSKAVRHSAARLALPVLLLVGWFGLSGVALRNYYFLSEYRKARNWPALTDYLRHHLDPRDLVIQLSADPAFGHYFDDSVLDIALPASPVQPPQEIKRLLDEYASAHWSVWLVGQTFPDWPNVGIVETWFADHMQPVLVAEIDSLRIQRYFPWHVQAGEIDAQSPLLVGDLAVIEAVHVETPPQPTGDLMVWLYWRPLRTTDKPLKVFVHLIDDVNRPPLTQDDHFPQSGRVSTSTWQTGTLLRDVYTLPLASVSAGIYSLYTGFYDPNTGERLAASPIRIGTVTVKK